MISPYDFLSVVNACSCLYVIREMLRLATDKQVTYVWNIYFIPKIFGLILLFFAQWKNFHFPDEFVYFLKSGTLFMCFSSWAWCKSMERQNAILKEMGISLHETFNISPLNLTFMSFFSRLFDNFFSRISRTWKNAISKVRPYMNRQIPAAVLAVEAFKNIVESPIVSAVTLAIPGERDDVILIRARKVLPKLLITLKIVQKCSNMESDEAIVKCGAEVLRGMTKETRGGKYIDLATQLSLALVDDGKITFGEMLRGVQEWYDANIADK